MRPHEEKCSRIVHTCTIADPSSCLPQLYIIQKVMGALTGEHMELFLRNPRYAGFKFPDMGRPEVRLPANPSRRADKTC